MSISLARSWDLGTSRVPARRAGIVVGLAQLPLRPLLSLLARPVWIGAENLPAEGAAIGCGNHLGPIDALAYGQLLQAHGIAPRFLAKETMFRVPVLGPLLRGAHQIPVHRGTAGGGDALDSARAALGRGELIMICPEGTYTRDPQLWPMQGRLGAARLALDTGAPLVPIASWGGRRLWPVGSPIPRPGRGRHVVIRVGTPYTVAQRDEETAQQAARRVTADLMARIAALLGETRGARPPSVLHDGRIDVHRPEAGSPQRGYRAAGQK